MKNYTVQVPEGFELIEEVDGDTTTISFIPKIVEKKLPTTLEEAVPDLPDTLYWINDAGEICNNTKDRIFSVSLEDPNILTSKEYAQAFLALMQLIRFRDIWNDGWIPDWCNSSVLKYIITFDADIIVTCNLYYKHAVLAFKSAELRNKFLEVFEPLIKTAKPLL